LLERSRWPDRPPHGGRAARLGLIAEVVPGRVRRGGPARFPPAAAAPGARVLLPRAAETRDVLVRELTAHGARVTEVGRLPHARGHRARADCARRSRRPRGRVTFTSSSTVRSFCALFGSAELPRLLRGVTVPASVHHAGHRGGSRARHPDRSRGLHDPGPGPRHRDPLRARKELAHAVPCLPSRRLRESPLLRSMVRETALRMTISSTRSSRCTAAGAEHRLHARAVPALHRRAAQGVARTPRPWDPAVLLFGLPRDKDPRGTEAHKHTSVITSRSGSCPSPTRTPAG